jgi:hypothetical protein
MARRPAGISSQSLSRFKGDIGRPPSAAEERAVAKVIPQDKSQRLKVHAGAYTHDEAFNEEQHDLGPWVETAKSTRVSAFRYDYLNRALQVTWRNNTNHGYIYLGVDREVYRSMTRIASKGRFVNSTLNGYEYRVMWPDEVQALSNANRQALTSRVR